MNVRSTFILRLFSPPAPDNSGPGSTFPLFPRPGIQHRVGLAQSFIFYFKKKWGQGILMNTISEAQAEAFHFSLLVPTL